MNRQMKGLWYLYSVDARYPLTIFWSILIGTLLISMIGNSIALRFASDGVHMAFTLSAAVYIFSAIYGFQVAKKLIPFSIKIGATRKNMYKGIGVFLFVLAILQAIVTNVVQSVAKGTVTLLGMKQEAFQFFHPAQLLAGNWLERVGVDTIVSFFLLVTLYVIGLVFYKFGLLGGGSVLGILVVVLFMGLSLGFLVDFVKYVVTSFSMTSFYALFAGTLILYGVSWWLVRRLTIRTVR